VSRTPIDACGFRQLQHERPRRLLFPNLLSIPLVRCCIRHTRQSGVKTLAASSLSPQLQIILRRQSRPLSSQPSADELIDRDTLMRGILFGVLMQRLWQTNTQCTHGLTSFFSFKKTSGLSTWIPKSAVAAKLHTFQVTMSWHCPYTAQLAGPAFGCADDLRRILWA
jgi:hypothetical protein